MLALSDGAEYDDELEYEAVLVVLGEVPSDSDNVADKDVELEKEAVLAELAEASVLETDTVLAVLAKAPSTDCDGVAVAKTVPVELGLAETPVPSNDVADRNAEPAAEAVAALGVAEAAAEAEAHTASAVRLHGAATPVGQVVQGVQAVLAATAL